MDVYAGLAAAHGQLTGAAVTIGSFDGVHLGHRKLIEWAIAHGRERGTRAAALTFWPHPAQVLAPKLAPPLISNRARRIELFESAGLDAVIEQPFDKAFAAILPADFEKEIWDDVGARVVVVGYDFTYGKGRNGNVDTLRAAGAKRGAMLVVVPPVSVNGLVVSSTKVREFVLAGNVEAARSLLGRPFDLEGSVVHGAGRGRTIGVPTANVAVEPSGSSATLLPGIGVYAVRVRLPDGTWAMGACNVGLNPTFRPESTDGMSARSINVEVHVLDRSLDMYGQTLRLAFIARLRAERRFPNVQALVAQIKADIDETRSVLAAE